MKRAKELSPAVFCSEAARIVGVSADTIRRMERDGVLTATRIGTTRLFDRRQLEEVAAKRRER